MQRQGVANAKQRRTVSLQSMLLAEVPMKRGDRGPSSGNELFLDSSKKSDAHERMESSLSEQPVVLWKRKNAPKVGSVLNMCVASLQERLDLIRPKPSGTRRA